MKTSRRGFLGVLGAAAAACAVSVKATAKSVGSVFISNPKCVAEHKMVEEYHRRRNRPVYETSGFSGYHVAMATKCVHCESIYTGHKWHRARRVKEQPNTCR